MCLIVIVWGALDEHRDVNWKLLKPGEPVVQEIEVLKTNSPDPFEKVQIRSDIRFHGPGQGVFRLTCDDILITEQEGLSVTISDPWNSPFWLSVPSTLTPGVHRIELELIQSSVAVSIADGDHGKLPEDRKSYNRWWILGDARILGEGIEDSPRGPVILAVSEATNE